MQSNLNHIEQENRNLLKQNEVLIRDIAELVTDNLKLKVEASFSPSLVEDNTLKREYMPGIQPDRSQKVKFFK